jgi:hypothetical protein
MWTPLEVDMLSSAKKRRGRPRSKYRPVLAARVPAEFLARIKASARTHGRNASEELMWLAELGLNWNTALEDASTIREKAFSEASAILAAAKRITSEDKMIEDLLERAATRALEKQKAQP